MKIRWVTGWWTEKHGRIKIRGDVHQVPIGTEALCELRHAAYTDRIATDLPMITRVSYILERNGRHLKSDIKEQASQRNMVSLFSKWAISSVKIQQDLQFTDSQFKGVSLFERWKLSNRSERETKQNNENNEGEWVVITLESRQTSVLNNLFTSRVLHCAIPGAIQWLTILDGKRYFLHVSDMHWTHIYTLAWFKNLNLLY